MKKKILNIIIIVTLLLFISSCSLNQISFGFKNNEPVADAGENINCFQDEEIILDASNSYDPDRDDLEFKWSINGKEYFDKILLTELKEQGTYEAILEVSDGQEISTDSIVITVEKSEIDIKKEMATFWKILAKGEKSYTLAGHNLIYTAFSLTILELASMVNKDFFLAEILIKAELEKNRIEPTEEMEKIISLIVEWADNKSRAYEYYSDYIYYGELVSKIESDNLHEKTEIIYDEYNSLVEKYFLAYKEIYKWIWFYRKDILIYCNKCGKEISDGSEFCNYCGSKTNGKELTSL